MSIDFATVIDLQQSAVDRLVGSSSILQPATPAFSVYGTVGAVGINQYVIYNAEIYDIGGGYNTANGLYTAPVGGVYYFNAHFLPVAATAGENRHGLYKNGVAYGGGTYIQTKDATGYITMRCGGHIQMAAGDTVGMYRTVGGASYTGGTWFAFGGMLVA